MNSMLNKVCGMFMGLEQTLRKALTVAERSPPRSYSELLATSLGRQNNLTA
ncbi:hypothetical protein L9F63_025432, partial [Diploptera punctata]